MKENRNSQKADTQKAIQAIKEAVKAKKCWSCGCLHNSIKTIEKEKGDGDNSFPKELSISLEEGKKRLEEVQYECLGCPRCFPSEALEALGIEGYYCLTEEVERREGWPPLPGSYSTLRYQAPIAVCTLTDSKLSSQIQNKGLSTVAITGTMQTENLGIERLIENTISNPNIRFLVICGRDSKQKIGHLPGQSLVALDQNGIDDRGRIIGARGKRPRIKNLSSEAVEHFRNTVEVIDRIDEKNLSSLFDLFEDLSNRNSGPVQPFESKRTVETIQGYLPERMIPDQQGYFVIYADHTRKKLVMEHYTNTGVLHHVIEGNTPAEVYYPAIEKNLVSALDHAAYLGRELARAEACLKSSRPYVQDGAPEQKNSPPSSNCGCQSECKNSGRTH